MLTDLAGLRFNVVTFCSIVAGAWVAVLSLNTHCQPIEHNETVCTQALSDDMPSMHQPNLQPLLPYKMHLLYVIMLFEAHRQQDINSTSVFGQLIPSVHSTALCYRSLHRRNLCQVHTTDAVSILREYSVHPLYLQLLVLSSLFCVSSLTNPPFKVLLRNVGCNVLQWCALYFWQTLK